MKARAIARSAPHAVTPRTIAAALVLLAVILAGTTGVMRVELSGAPQALAVPEQAR